MSSCKDIHMPTIAIISQKGGAGKTTLALHLAAAAEDSGHTALVIDLDPQATASQWAAWRQDVPPVVIDSAPPRLAAKIEQATAQGAEFIVIDTPPHADSAASAAVEAADLRSAEHTSELQSLMRISYAVFCLKKKTLHKSTTEQLDNITHNT